MWFWDISGGRSTEGRRSIKLNLLIDLRCDSYWMSENGTTGDPGLLLWYVSGCMCVSNERVISSQRRENMDAVYR